MPTPPHHRRNLGPANFGATAIVESDLNRNTSDLRMEMQGSVTFYHSLSTPGYWFNAGELEAMIQARAMLRLPEPPPGIDMREEFRRGLATCPRCGSEIKLFEMHSYLDPEILMGACHVCHGRWIGELSLKRLLDQVYYSGFVGSLRRVFARRPVAERREEQQ